MELCPDLGSCCRFELTPAVLREAVRPDWNQASQALQALLTAVADLHRVGRLCFQGVNRAIRLCCLNLASSPLASMMQPFPTGPDPGLWGSRYCTAHIHYPACALDLMLWMLELQLAV